MLANSTRRCAIVIPAYNAARYLNETLRSVLDCADCIDEIIIVDDGSIDNTLQIAKNTQWINGTINIQYQANSGVSSARNTGLAQVTAEYVCFLDADDRLIEGGISALIRHLRESPDSIGAFGRVRYIDETSKLHELSHSQQDSVPSPIVTLLDVLQANFVDTPGAILFRTDAIRRVGGFDTSLTVGEDWELYTRVCMLGTIIRCSEPVVEYRVHSASAMRQGSLRAESFEPVLSKVFSSSRKYEKLVGEKMLRRFELRKKASILRTLGRSSSNMRRSISVVFHIMLIIMSSRFDRKVLALGLGASLTVGKRCLMACFPLSQKLTGS